MNKDISQTSIEIDNEEFYITKKIKGSKKPAKPSDLYISLISMKVSTLLNSSIRLFFDLKSKQNKYSLFAPDL